ncbi:hypothetical protein C8R45DRAFT_1173626 [Mycena sanguinolenta]|nr:hypothetical protein C8R45DRAFT_1173626 [Mycena sanguinolenta]
MVMEIRTNPTSSASGSIEMDAPHGTSNGTGSLGHSAVKSHSSFGADESGHRSRNADVGLEGEGISDNGPSTPVASLGNGAPVAPGSDEIPYGTPDFSALNEFAQFATFSTPKRTSRASSPRSASPGLNPARWFSHELLTVEEPVEEVAAVGEASLIDWSESTDEDGLGPIPPAWIKQESMSVDLNWSLPDDAQKFSLDNLVREIDDNMTPTQRELIHRRTENMKAMDIRRDSEASSRTFATNTTVPNNIPNTRAKPNTNPSAISSPTSPRIPAELKGKGKATEDGSHKLYVEEYVSDDEEDEEEDPRAAQEAADAALAQRIHEDWNADVVQPVQVNAVRIAPRAGPSNVQGIQNANLNPIAAENAQIANDANIAKQLQEIFDEQRKSQRDFTEQREALDEQRRIIENAQHDLEERIRSWESAKDADARRLNPQTASGPMKIEPTSTPQKRPTPVDQIPRNSVLFQEVKPRESASQPAHDGDDSSDNSSSDDLPELMSNNRKARKKRAKAARRARAAGTAGNEPSDSSSSSSSSESGGNSAWSELGDPPSDTDSDDSRATKKKKKKAKRKWNLKLLRLKLEQSNAKPDPPFVYNSEPVFAKAECWIYDTRNWCRQSYIRPNMHYKTELENLADSVGDISERSLIVRFWDGARTTIQKEWAHDGYDPESSSLRQLVSAAVNYEQAQKLTEAIDKNKHIRENLLW